MSCVPAVGLILVNSVYKGIKKHERKNMAQIPTDDINKVGEWLADNMRFQHEREM